MDARTSGDGSLSGSVICGLARVLKKLEMLLAVKIASAANEGRS